MKSVIITILLLPGCFGIGCAGRSQSFRPLANQTNQASRAKQAVQENSPTGRSHNGNDSENILPVRYETAVESAGNSSETGENEEKRVPPATSDLWTLDRAITETLLADPLLNAAREDIWEARAEFTTSSLIPNPVLSTGGVLLPYSPITEENPGGPPEYDIGFSWSVDWFVFAKRAAARNSTRIGIAQSQSEVEQTICLRVTETAVAFYDLLEAEQLLELAQQNVNTMEKLSNAVKKGVEAGGLPTVELNRVRLDLLQSQEALMNAKSANRIAKTKLRALLGMNEIDSSFAVEGNLALPSTTQILPLEEAFELAKVNRPDIQALRHRLTRSYAEQEVERRNAYPEINASFGHSIQYQEALGDPNYRGWGVGIDVGLPIFDRNQGNRAKTDSMARRSRHLLQLGVTDLLAEIEQADQELRTALAKATVFAEEQLQRATQVRDSYIQSYQSGGHALIDVLDAERTWHDTYQSYITGRADYWRAWYLYNNAIGR